MGVRERLADLVAARGIAQAELARRVGEHPNWVNNRLRGVVEIKADDLTRLARALDVSPAVFFEAAGGDQAGRPGRRPERALGEVLSAALLRALRELPAEARAALLAPAEPATGPAEAAPAADRRAELRRDLAGRASRSLARAWEELPEEEQRFIWEIVEARRRMRERGSGG